VKRSADLLTRVAQFMGRICAQREAGVVAVSGGPDSVALTRLLVHLQQRGQIGRLILAHVNHQLRGIESDADEAFVCELARSLGVPAIVTCRLHRVDVAGLAQERGDNLENTARQVRYDWLGQVAREEGAAWIATGHTADDQAETVLHRLLRGTGLHGLCAIPQRRELAPGIEVVRPLLHTSRDDVLAYLTEEQQPFCHDRSNADVAFMRNRIRHELLPELARQYNPAIVSVLCRLADQAGAVQLGIEAEAAKLLADAELPRAGSLLIFSRPNLAAASRHLVREMFRLVWNRENWPAGAMGFEEWERLASVAAGEEKAIDLPDGVRARRAGSVVQVGWR
jgi:tRNA(Ile)-lysidine synthase